MIKINWSEVDNLKTILMQQGQTEAFEMVVVVLYSTKSSCDKVQVKLGSLEESLFSIGGDRNVRGILLYDIEMKRPYLRFCEEARVNTLETVSGSGHPNLILEFKNMTSEARDVWVEITMSRLQHFLSQAV